MTNCGRCGTWRGGGGGGVPAAARGGGCGRARAAARTGAGGRGGGRSGGGAARPRRGPAGSPAAPSSGGQCKIIYTYLHISTLSIYTNKTSMMEDVLGTEQQSCEQQRQGRARGVRSWCWYSETMSCAPLVRCHTPLKVSIGKTQCLYFRIKVIEQQS